MCGICGVLNKDLAQEVSNDLLKAMTDVIRHRGPDDEGTFLDRNVGLGIRRLSVIDPEGGMQPQQTEDGRHHIVFNGEIYNYPELRRASENRGHRFRSKSDTETVLHLYEDRGADCVLPLNGMFAFAVYDAADRTLMIARDRLGIKPLYYADTGRSFVFASEIKALLVHPDVSREIDPTALDQFLAYKYIPGPRTIFKGIRKLPPGHILIWKSGRLDVRSYWKLSFAAGLPKSDEEVAEELMGRIRNAVRMQMISDVPLGAFLSGGIDSSLIVALMQEVSSQPVKTFSIGFKEGSYNELDRARLAAKQFGTDHHELVVESDALGILERVVSHFDEPFGDSSAIPTFLVSSLAREHVTVALSGSGADELFAGYERYWAIPLSSIYRRVPGSVKRLTRSGLTSIPSGHAKKSLIWRARRFIESAEHEPFAQHQQLVGLFSEAERGTLYTDDWKSSLAGDGSDPLAERLMKTDADSELDKLLDLDTATLLADDYLVKDDRMSMAVSLELRVPFLDHTLVEFAASLPPELKLRGLTSKYILKKASRGVLPRRILKGPKHGFEIPVARWIASDLRDFVNDLILSPGAAIRSYMDQGVIENLINCHASGHSNLSRQIWALISLEMWHRTNLKQETYRPK